MGSSPQDRIVSGLCLGLLVLLVVSGCVRAPGPHPRDRDHRDRGSTATRAPCDPGQGPPAHAPAHGYRAKCPYRYYPRLQVYYSPKADVWFWIEGEDWEFGATLPDRFSVEDKNHVTVKLQTPYPYQKHDKVRKKHGPDSGKGSGDHPGRGKGPPPHAGP